MKLLIKVCKGPQIFLEKFVFICELARVRTNPQHKKFARDRKIICARTLAVNVRKNQCADFFLSPHILAVLTILKVWALTIILTLTTNLNFFTIPTKSY